jgi:hypothetical protein
VRPSRAPSPLLPPPHATSTPQAPDTQHSHDSSCFPRRFGARGCGRRFQMQSTLPDPTLSAPSSHWTLVQFPADSIPAHSRHRCLASNGFRRPPGLPVRQRERRILAHWGSAPNLANPPPSNLFAPPPRPGTPGGGMSPIVPNVGHSGQGRATTRGYSRGRENAFRSADAASSFGHRLDAVEPCSHLQRMLSIRLNPAYPSPVKSLKSSTGVSSPRLGAAGTYEESRAAPVLFVPRPVTPFAPPASLSRAAFPACRVANRTVDPCREGVAA